jgi:plastocyanin
MALRAAIAALCTCFIGCIDFGEAPSPDAETAVADADVNGACVEGIADAAFAENTINIVRFNVDPLEMTIAANTVVAFTNTDSRNHRMLGGTPEQPLGPEEGGFNTGLLAPGASYGHRFCTPRLMIYYCSSHPGTMNGYRIVIE